MLVHGMIEFPPETLYNRVMMLELQQSQSDQLWSEMLTGTVCVSVSFELIPALLPAATLLQWPLRVL